MKRKKNTVIAGFVLTVMLISLLTGCGAQTKSTQNIAPQEAGHSNDSRGDGSNSNSTSKSAIGSSNGGIYGSKDGESFSLASSSSVNEPELAADTIETSDSSKSTAALPQAETGEKIIYSGYAEIETLEFDTTVEKVYRIIDRYNGFIESSKITGNDYKTKYYNDGSHRTAHFVVRIPKEDFSEMKDGLTELGNVTYSSTQAQNITSQYTDTQSQLKAYRTEEGRLLEILEKASAVADMITIEDRLAQVRYNIENLTTQINGWDSKINYSTLELNVTEVAELSEKPVTTKTFWQQIVEGMTGSAKWLIKFCKAAIVFILSAIPLLIIPVLIVFAVFYIRTRRRRKPANEMKNSDDGKK